MEKEEADTCIINDASRPLYDGSYTRYDASHVRLDASPVRRDDPRATPKGSEERYEPFMMYLGRPSPHSSKSSESKRRNRQRTSPCLKFALHVLRIVFTALMSAMLAIASATTLWQTTSIRINPFVNGMLVRQKDAACSDIADTQSVCTTPWSCAETLCSGATGRGATFLAVTIEAPVACPSSLSLEGMLFESTHPVGTVMLMLLAGSALLGAGLAIVWSSRLWIVDKDATKEKRFRVVFITLYILCKALCLTAFGLTCVDHLAEIMPTDGWHERVSHGLALGQWSMMATVYVMEAWVCSIFFSMNVAK